MTAPRTPVELIIDRCIEDLRAGRLTVEDCLLRFPQDREILEPALRAAAAMTSLPRIEQARTPDPVRRAAFMAALRETPQQRRRRLRVPSLATLLSVGAFRVVGPAFALAALAVVIVLGGGATPATASTLTVFGGEVQRLDGVEWKTLRDGSALGAGVRVRTAAGSHAMITFPDGSTVALEPQTEIVIETLAMSPRRIEVRQQSGRLWHDVVHDQTDGSRFIVLTPDARIEVLGTVFETSVDPATGKTDVATVEGEVRVVAGERAVPVGRGETLRASKATIEEVATAPLVDSALIVTGPFASALLTADGRGTGVRIDGVVFRQLRGITTTSNPGMQRFDLQAVDPGEYTLIVQRYADGAGEIVLDMPEGQQRFVIEAGVTIARLPLRLDITSGIPLLAAASLEAGIPASAPVVRVTESERTKAAVDLIAQAREKQREQDDDRDTVRAAVTRTATKTPAIRATTATPEQKAPTPRATTRTAIATPTPDPTRATTTRSAPPTATPQSRTTVTAQADAELSAAYARRLRAAITSGDLDAIRLVLEEAVGGESVALRRARANAIMSALENQTSAQRIAALFVDGQNAKLREGLHGTLSAHSEVGSARLDAAIVIAEARRLQQLSKPQIPTPTPTPTRTAAPLNQATTTTTPTVTATPARIAPTTPSPSPTRPPVGIPTIPPLLPTN